MPSRRSADLRYQVQSDFLGYHPPPLRPGLETVLAWLGYLQAGFVTTGSLVVVLGFRPSALEPLMIGVLQMISVVFLIIGSMRIRYGTDRATFVAANVAQLVLIIYWSTRGYALDILPPLAVFFAGVPGVALTLLLLPAPRREPGRHRHRRRP